MSKQSKINTPMEIKKSLKRSDIHKKLLKTSIGLNSKYPFYGEMLLQFSFYESKLIPTCAVNVSKDSRVSYRYNYDWITKLNQKEMNFVTIHEIFHILFDHPSRTIKSMSHTIANIAQDMIINSIIYDKIDKNFAVVPIDRTTGKVNGLFPPKEYTGRMIFEELYNWLLDLKENPEKFGIDKNKMDKQSEQMGDTDQTPKDGQKNSGITPDELKDEQGGKQDKEDSLDSSGNGEDKEGKPGKQKESKGNTGRGKGQDQERDVSKEEDENGDGKGNTPEKANNPSSKDQNHSNIEDVYKLLNSEQNEGQTLDIHMDDDVPPEVKKQVVEDIISALKTRGLVQGNIESVLGELRKSKKDWLKEVKRIISIMCGEVKDYTWFRPNRKGLPIPGYKKYGTEFNVILDTSGSMSGAFEKVLSTIFQKDLAIFLFQIDTDVQDVRRIKSKNELKKMNIKGLGGTTLQPAIEMIISHKKYRNLPTVILTDGCTDTLDFTRHKGRVLILSTEDICPISGGENKVKQVVLPKEI